jgi:D-alanyl-D-alanine dipeptidase
MSIPGSIEKLLVRQSVGAMLEQADRRFRSVGLKIHVHDAFRPIEVQSYFHDTWMPQKLQLKYPHMTRGKLLEEVEKYWAAPTRSSDSPAPHSTGAALDLSLYTLEHNEPLYMGSIFDDVTEKAHVDYFELASAVESYSDLEALRNRRLLYWVLTEAGFASNPNEWWHFSWGDQMWARITVQDAAIYSVTKMPAAEAPAVAGNPGECGAAASARYKIGFTF